MTLTKDTPFNVAPKYTYGAAASYDCHIGTEGRLTPKVDVRGVGRKPALPGRRRLPAYALVGFRPDYQPRENGTWRIGCTAPTCSTS